MESSTDADRRAEQWIGVWVDDVDAMYERVTAAGVAVDPPEDKPYGVRILTVTDPEGYRRASYGDSPDLVRR
jgi:uncharacterized glyoxalase superfamily protein PhnB